MIASEIQSQLYTTISLEIDAHYRDLIAEGNSPEEAKAVCLEALKDAVQEIALWHKFSID